MLLKRKRQVVLGMKQRDHNIKKSYQREVDMRQKVVKSKKAYTRKKKHKKERETYDN